MTIVSRVRKRGEDIRDFILANVPAHPADIVRVTAEHFAITRQAAHKHISRLVEEQLLTVEGATKSCRYALGVFESWHQTYSLEGLEEDRVWRADIEPRLGALPENARKIWAYGFTEMLNNAIDHSEGSAVTIDVKKTAVGCRIILLDDGVGIFRKIKNALNLSDEREAALELAKGKLTTDPKRHSGQGIFFTSRIFNDYSLLSGGTYFNHELGAPHDWIDDIPQTVGTAVFMELKNHTSRSLRKLFDEFSSDDGDFRFNKTSVPVRLVKYGDEQLVSRSQAKRLMTHVDKFERVVLDFKGVATVGQAFADEIFRVFARANPTIELVAIHATSDVKRMIARAQSEP